MRSLRRKGALDSNLQDATGALLELRLAQPFADQGVVYLGAEHRGLVLKGSVFGATASETIVVYVDSVRHEVALAEDGSFVLTAALIEGREHPIRIEGSTLEPTSFSVILDREAPKLSRVLPAEVEVTAASCELALRVLDDHVSSVSLDGAELNLREDGLWALAELMLVPGSNSFVAVALDHAGNESRLEFELTRKTQGPALISSDPAEHAHVFVGEEFIATLEFDIPIESVTLDGTALELDSAGKRATGKLTVAPRLGVWRPIWSARDASGSAREGRLEYELSVRPKPVSLAGRALMPLSADVGWERWPRRVRDDRSGIVFRLIEPGAFFLGSDSSPRFEEHPAREARITRAFYLAETETTIAAWRKFVTETRYLTSAEESKRGITRGVEGAQREHPAATWQEPTPEFALERDEEHPVTQVSWLDATKFSEHYAYRLPTEAEWEYACRAGAPDEYSWDDELSLGLGYGNFSSSETSERFPLAPSATAADGFAATAPVASFLPNAWGLYDMHGNVWEWCADEFDPLAHTETALKDPARLSERTDLPRVLRGGSWLGHAETCARRSFDLPSRSADTRGFASLSHHDLRLHPSRLRDDSGRVSPRARVPEWQVAHRSRAEA